MDLVGVTEPPERMVDFWSSPVFANKPPKSLLTLPWVLHDRKGPYNLAREGNKTGRRLRLTRNCFRNLVLLLRMEKLA